MKGIDIHIEEYKSIGLINSGSSSTKYAEVKNPKLNPIIYANNAIPVANTLSYTGNHLSAIIPGVESYHTYVNVTINVPKNAIV